MPPLSDLPPGTPVIAGVLGLILLLLLFALRGRGARRAYRRAGPLFTPAEQRFLEALEKAVDGRARVYGKVRLADLLAARTLGENADAQHAAHIRAAIHDLQLHHDEVAALESSATTVNQALAALE